MSTTSLEFGWFNQVCKALGLFDGARPESPERVLWSEVLPMIEALKSDRPSAAIMIQELQRTRELWHDALKQFSDTNQERLRLQAENVQLRAALARLSKPGEP